MNELARLNPKLERWYPPVERMGFVADRDLCVQVVEMWLMGESEKSIVAILGTSEEKWNVWKRDESFNYLVAALTDPVRGLVHGRFTRLTAKALDRIEEALDAGGISPRVLAQLTAVLVDKQVEIEKRMAGQSEVPGEVKELWKRLENWSKANPVKSTELKVIDGEASREQAN